MNITTSKIGTVNLLDIAKGFIVAALTAALMALQVVLDNGTIDAVNWKPLLMAAISGGVGYLLKNLFSQSKIIIKDTENETIEKSI